MRYALVLEYDGRGFRGWQRQPDAPTVQASVEDALGAIADHPVAVTCAGRTDAGVHAIAQVVHFDSVARRETVAWMLGANTHLPATISVVWAAPVAADFHARFSAVERSYRYVILNRSARSALHAGRAWCVHRRLSLQPMRAAARALVGEHDFSAFRAAACQSRSPLRCVTQLEIAAAGDYIVIDISANAFLHNMVRIVAGVLVAVGSGRRAPEWVAAVLESRDRTLAGATAPADGLYLTGVRYAAPHEIPAQRTLRL